MSNQDGSPLSNLLGGLFLIAIGIGGYFLFNHLETNGGSMRIPVIAIGLYNLIGKWGILGIFAVLGGFLAGSSIVRMVKGEE